MVTTASWALASPWSFLVPVAQVLDSLVQMGVLVPTGDRTAIRRTAVFFLNRWAFPFMLCPPQKGDLLSGMHAGEGGIPMENKRRRRCFPG